MKNGNYLFHPRTKGQLEAEDSIGAYLSQQVAQTEDERCAGVQGREQRGRKAGGGREERRKRERRGGDGGVIERVRECLKGKQGRVRWRELVESD
jgi:hypothetical protein